MAKRYDFSDALKALKAGYRVARDLWVDKSYYIFLSTASKNLEDHFVLKTKTKYNVWYPTVNDLLAEDWIVLPKGDPDGEKVKQKDNKINVYLKDNDKETHKYVNNIDDLLDLMDKFFN